MSCSLFLIGIGANDYNLLFQNRTDEIEPWSPKVVEKIGSAIEVLIGSSQFPISRFQH
jgi:hypothetical protein